MIYLLAFARQRSISALSIIFKIVLLFSATKHFNTFVPCMKHTYSLLFFCFISVLAFAQAGTDTVKPDTLKKNLIQVKKKSALDKDSLPPKIDSTLIHDSLRGLNLDTALKKPVIDSHKKDETKSGLNKLFKGKEYFFYYLVFLFLLLGLMRRAFSKYFNDLFRVFFRTTLKQKQVGDQLLQSPLPSVLLNCFFVLTAGLYINILLFHFHLTSGSSFWLQYIYCMAALALIYIVKFLGLKIAGWLFKMMGIMLLPFLVLFAFTSDPVYTFSLNVTWVGIGLLLLYRFILSFGAVHNEIKLNSFHFLLYIIAMEIVPLLLIYKLLLIIL
jgi:hypothetical protein